MSQDRTVREELRWQLHARTATCEVRESAAEFDLWLETKIELIERFHIRQVCQLQPRVQISLPSRLGFGTQHFEQEIGIRRFFLGSPFQQCFQLGVDGCQTQCGQRGSHLSS
jgi:hypothetical protein